MVRQLLDHVETVTHRQWFDAIGGCLRFSEDILYGVYVDEVLGIGSPIADRRGPCHTYWDAEPLALPEALEFVRGVRPDDVAVMISAKSRTPLSVRQAAIASAAHSVGDAAVSPAARRSPPARHRRITSR
jgi:hypothetical protein